MLNNWNKLSLKLKVYCKKKNNKFKKLLSNQKTKRHHVKDQNNYLKNKEET